MRHHIQIIGSVDQRAYKTVAFVLQSVKLDVLQAFAIVCAAFAHLPRTRLYGSGIRFRALMIFCLYSTYGMGVVECMCRNEVLWKHKSFKPIENFGAYMLYNF